jgi:hypothetical protein
MRKTPKLGPPGRDYANLDAESKDWKSAAAIRVYTALSRKRPLIWMKRRLHMGLGIPADLPQLHCQGLTEAGDHSGILGVSDALPRMFQLRPH